MSNTDVKNADFPNLALDAQLCFALRRATRSITRAYTKRLQPLGITYPQYLVLLTLWTEKCLPARKIADLVCLDPSSVTPLLKRLEHSGLVTRRRPENNQRTVLVELTERGRGLRAETAKVQYDVARMTGLSPAELSAFRQELHGLADILDAAGATTSAVA